MASTADTIIGLKTNCARGYSIADYWEGCYKQTIDNTLKAWRLIPNLSDVEPLAWTEVKHKNTYINIMSSHIGVLSEIREKVFPQTTYKTKKGVTKTKPEERVMCHFTADGQYIGRVDKLGDTPITYPISIHVNPRTCQFVKVGLTLGDCFMAKEEIQYLEQSVLGARDVSRAELKALRKSNKDAEASSSEGSVEELDD